MAEILLADEYLADRVSCPGYVAENLQKYIFKFDRWVQDDGRFRAFDPEGNLGNSFGRDDVFDWFNNIALSDSKEKMVYLQRDYWPSQQEFKRLPVFYV